MKTITALKLQQKNKDRVNLFLDGEYAFAVSFSAAAELRAAHCSAPEGWAVAIPGSDISASSQ